ncbi:recombinase family protein [Nocardioides eburneiflavus]|nr:recombinase family protein [Nocardioides eburneiflavus]
MRVAIYARISSDRDGARLGVARQVEDCKALAAKKGWTVTTVLEDNDLSAWTGKPRPGYETLLDLMREGHIDAVVVWHTDRLTRSSVDLNTIITAAERHNVVVHSVMAGLLDLSTASGKMQARIVGAVAEHESDQKAERIRRKHQELAEAGKPASLGQAYGYNADGTVNAVEAAVIRDLVARLLAGESIRSLTRWLNAEGIRSKKGGEWSTSTVRQVLTSGRICGWREWTPRTPRTREERANWNGKPRRGWGMGELVAEGEWEGIISRSQTDRIRALLDDPERRTTKRRHYLLSAGILKCGVCGRSMNHKVESRVTRIAMRDEQGRTVKDAQGRVVRVRKPGATATTASRYACIAQPGRGCGRVSISCPEVDALVTEAVFEALSGADLSPRASTPSDSEVAAIRDQMADAEARLVQVGLDHADGVIGRAEWLAMKKRIESNLEGLRARLPDAEGANVLAALPTGSAGLRRAWSEMDLDLRRAVVQAVIERVIVHPSRGPKGSARFDPDRVEAVWRA